MVTTPRNVAAAAGKQDFTPSPNYAEETHYRVCTGQAKRDKNRQTKMRGDFRG